MPSKAKPVKGTVPDSNGKDVKETADSSTVDEIEEKTSVQAAEEKLDENDLNALEDEKKIPYQRFKEKNEEAKALKAQLEESEHRYKNEVLRLTAEKEAIKSLESQKADAGIFDLDQEENDLKRQVSQLSQQLKSMEQRSEASFIQTQLDRLSAKYPDADATAVLGWKKVRPNEDLEELMELSHNRNVERTSNKVREILEKKKQKSKQSLPVRESGFKIQDSEKPKTVKEAHSLIKRFLDL